MPTTRVLRVDPRAPDSVSLEEAAAIIRAGGLVAFPTETVYGLGANALDAEAVARIFAAKGRPAEDPLIVHVADASAVAAIAETSSPWIEPLAARFWPGPLTLVLPRRPVVPSNVTAGRDTVAVRVPAHPVARGLIERADRPIAAPSANLYARPSPTTAAHVLEDLAGRIDLVLDGGPTPVGVESTVLDLTVDPPAVLRPGGITTEQLRVVLPDLQAGAPVHGVARSPGTARRHYSPRARVDLFEAAEPTALHHAMAGHITALRARGQSVALLAFDDDLPGLPTDLPTIAIGSTSSLDAAARRLYAALRELDAGHPDAIVARLPPARGLGLALRDRLRRAANGRVLPVLR